MVLLAPAATALGQIEFPTPSKDRRVVISAPAASYWKQGQHEVWHLKGLQGRCVIKQGDHVASANEAILWIQIGDPYLHQPDKLVAYLEGNTIVDYPSEGLPHQKTGRAANTIRDQRWLGRFSTTLGIETHIPQITAAPAQPPAILARAQSARESQSSPLVQPAQWTAPVPQGTAPPAQVAVNPPQTRVRFEPRSTIGFVISSFPVPERNEQITIIDRGVKVIIESDELSQLPSGEQPIDQVIIQADRAVAWSNQLDDLRSRDGNPDQTRSEVYLEGNIIFSSGQRVIYAERMYYDATHRRGTILQAEMLTPIDGYEGLLRLKADILQQINQENFRAYGAALTSSRLGVPRYWLQSNEVLIRHQQIPHIDPLTGQITLDQQTGRPQYDQQYLARSQNNFVYLLGAPIFYWPSFTTDLAKPTYYIDRFSIKNDSVFGTQVLTDWDVYQLLGIRNPPEQTKWTVGVDYLSERGLGLGTVFGYRGQNFMQLPGAYQGQLDVWGIYDQGLDNLGEDRRALIPEKDLRGRARFQHRHTFDVGYQLTLEAGLISDRNFLEQYFEREWDQEKDQTTGAELKRLINNQSFNLMADVRLNDFFTQTQWLPRLDHYLLGQSIFGDRLTWHARSHIGYGQLKTASTPQNAVDLAKFDPLGWEANQQGIRAGTRQEIDFPFSVGPVKLVPYALGDATYWENDLNGTDVTRLYGQAGFRASLPFWKANPTVQSVLFNLNGLAHKISLDADVFWADANRNFDRFPLYDPLDDDAQEAFRRRFFFDTFGGAAGGNVPLRFDERFYALRSGLQSNVSSPSSEIADDLMIAKLGVRQRWQTKRGMPGRQRIVDWIVLDIEGSYFPRAQRDNAGADFGLLDYDFRWHVGDRLTLLSDGYFDFFADGLRTVSLGGYLSRPELGNLYVGVRSIEGPISSNILTSSLSYRMSEKWILSAGASVDLGPAGNLGQTLSFTRIGESFLVRLGINADASRGNVGAVFSIEPRFLPRSRLGQVGGVFLPPPGSRGLE